MSIFISLESNPASFSLDKTSTVLGFVPILASLLIQSRITIYSLVSPGLISSVSIVAVAFEISQAGLLAFDIVVPSGYFSNNLIFPASSPSFVTLIL